MCLQQCRPPRERIGKCHGFTAVTGQDPQLQKRPVNVVQIPRICHKGRDVQRREDREILPLVALHAEEDEVGLQTYNGFDAWIDHPAHMPAGLCFRRIVAVLGDADNLVPCTDGKQGFGDTGRKRHNACSGAGQDNGPLKVVHQRYLRTYPGDTEKQTYRKNAEAQWETHEGKFGIDVCKSR